MRKYSYFIVESIHIIFSNESTFSNESFSSLKRMMEVCGDKYII